MCLPGFALAGWLLMSIGATSPILHVREANALVVCQKGKKIRLRPSGCVGKETRATVDADTLRGMTPEELLAPLGARIQALERLFAVATTTTTSVAVTTTTTTTTTLPSGRLNCPCLDNIQLTPCVAHIDCRLLSSAESACAQACAGHGGFSHDGLSCDNSDPSCM
jgi:hypothetical protein